MVMHARKHPRLNNDGYYDRKDSHPYQNAQYPSKSHPGIHPDRYDRRDSPSFRTRDDSPRYINKSSYIDRNREQLQQGSSGSPGDGRRPNHYAGGSSNSNGSGYGRSSKVGKEVLLGGSGGVPGGGQKDQKERDYRTEVHKSAVGWSGDWSEHISSSGKKYYYNCRSEVSQWERPKEWVGESPSGSRMLDNRPKDTRTGNSKQAPYTSNKSSSDRGRHSSGGERDRFDKQYREINRTSGSASSFPASVGSKTNVDKQTVSRSDYPLTNSSCGPSGSGSAWGNPPNKTTSIRMDDNSHSLHNKDNQFRRTSSSNYGMYTSSYSGGGKSHDRRDSEGSRPSAAVAGHYSRSSDRRSSENERRYSQHSEDMDISPSTSPPFSRQNSRQGASSLLSNVPVHPPSSTPVSVSTPSRVNAHPVGGAGHPIPTSSPVIGSLPHQITQLSPVARPNLPNNQDQEFAQKAFQTLQKLQEALSRQLARSVPCESPARSTSANTEALHQQTSRPHIGIQQALTGLVTSSHNPLMATGGIDILPLTQLQHQQQSVPQEESTEKGRETPRSEKSVRSGSPTPSISSSKEAPLGTSALSAAGMRQAVPQLTPSLANHYNEKLISHVQGWQADHAERQANRYMEEHVNIGSVLCQQVSVELKRARSLVRLAAIQSTLQEQRCAAINALKNH